MRHLGQVDKVGQHSRVMDVQVTLQLIPNGLAQQLHAVVGCLCIMLIARLTPGTVLGAVAACPTAWLS